MKNKRFLVFLGLILVMMLSFPGIASAQTDKYGYNAEAMTFKGTLDNWEIFISGTGADPIPFTWRDKGTVFLERKWDKRFNAMLQGNPPSAPGAWEKADLWEYLTGDQLGWTWHETMEIVYSPNTPIPNAIAVPAEDMGLSGFYYVQLKEWTTGPKGEVIVSQDLSLKNKPIKGPHKGHTWKH
ncbi:hypothetical protein REC12_08715 [Desulfosporosinus sp. PR]|uniref:hypothetical protein n=1 Tax=Candidatus Desulfosporosinus nitrosoreducens TaxID=3401928 RepID=UPI0027ED244A|nr:hypothetical protein [Desulfosporosinus sp. PR]MDQ7093670.1 hypothetical protein [Desulfosporosinus sp. PR]